MPFLKLFAARRILLTLQYSIIFLLNLYQTTVGLGDFVPDTALGADFLFFWASVGLGLLATFLTNLSEGVAGFGDRLKYIPFMAFSGAGNRDKKSHGSISER